MRRAGRPAAQCSRRQWGGWQPRDELDCLPSLDEPHRVEKHTTSCCCHQGLRSARGVNIGSMDRPAPPISLYGPLPPGSGRRPSHHQRGVLNRIVGGGVLKIRSTSDLLFPLDSSSPVPYLASISTPEHEAPLPQRARSKISHGPRCYPYRTERMAETEADFLFSRLSRTRPPILPLRRCATSSPSWPSRSTTPSRSRYVGSSPSSIWRVETDRHAAL